MRDEGVAGGDDMREATEQVCTAAGMCSQIAKRMIRDARC